MRRSKAAAIGPRLCRSAGVLPALALGLLSWSAASFANPLGGQVVGGSATITAPNPSELDITQSTDRAAINWQSFDIAAGQLTRFSQPSASSVALNRVMSANPSTIAGRLTANGALVLINPNGITFAKGSQVNVNSLVATPTDIDTGDFLAGRMSFSKPSPNPKASVVNQGTITVAQQGLAALVAPSVANAGVIQATLGRVVLGGAQTFTVDLYGDGLIAFDVGSQVKTVPAGGPGSSLVSNAGDINAPGGTVLLTADAVAGIVEQVVDVSGRIAAQSYAGRSGNVTINAGQQGNARISGTIDVSGLAPGQTAGSVTVTGGSVSLAGTAVVDARGDAGGGTIRIGGGAHGADPAIANAQTTNVAAGALIDASATGAGNGGTVVLWSDQATSFAGTVRADGGPKGGNGGWVETSGARLIVADAASVSTRSIAGTAGTWLLDPVNIDVETSGGTITPGTIVSGLAQGNVVLTADNDITIGATIDARTIAGATGSLSLFAGRNICIGGPACNALITPVDIILNGGSFSAEANSQAAGIDLANRGPGPGTFLMAMGDQIETLSSGAGGAVAPTLSISVAPTVGSSPAGPAISANLSNPGGDITINLAGDLTEIDPIAAGGSVSISTQGAMTLKQPVSAGTSVDLVAGGPLIIAGAITAGTTFNLSTAGNLTISSSPITVGISALFSATGAMAIGGAISAASVELDAGGALADGATVKATGPVTLDSGGDLTANGRISAGTMALLSATGSLVVGAPIAARDAIMLLAGREIAASASITAPSLIATSSGASGGGIALPVPGDTIGTVALTTQSGNIVFTDSTGFTENGITAPGALSLTATGGGIKGTAAINAGAALTMAAGGPIALGAVTGTVVSMRAAGPIAAGPVSAATLIVDSTAASGGGITLSDPGNAVGDVSLTARSGDIAFADATGFVESGISTPGAASLTSAGGGVSGRARIAVGGDLTVDAGGPIDLGSVGGLDIALAAAAGPITAGPVTAASLTVSSTAASGGGIALTDPGNAVGSVSLISRSGDIAFADSTGFTANTISTPGAASLSAAGSIGGSGHVFAGGGLTLNAAGPVTLGPVSAPNLTVASTAASGGGIALSAANVVPGTVRLTTQSGNISFSDASIFTAAGISAPGDVSLAAPGVTLGADIAAGGNVALNSSGSLVLTAADGFALRAGGDVLVSSGGALAIDAMTLAAGSVNAVVLSANGPLTQTGTLATGGAVIALDTTGLGAATLAAALPLHGSTPPSAALIDLFPARTTGNALQLGGLQAPGSVVLLLAGAGNVSGTLAAAGLGVSGTGGAAQLTGSINGNTTPRAALLGVITPRPQASYLFNTCIIGGASCGGGTPLPPIPPLTLPPSFPPSLIAPAALLAPLSPIAPDAISPATALIAVEAYATSEIDALLSGPQAVDPDAPVIDVFDEERLCNLKKGEPGAAGQCR